MNNKKFLLTGIALSVIVGLSACGGGTTSNLDAGNNSTTSGPITAFGSIFVNSVEYDTSKATVLIDGKTASEAELKVGMMVSVKKAGNTASSVSAGDEVEGIVLNPVPGTLTGEFNIMGQTVTVDDNTIFESKVAGITDASMIIADNVVEAHGYSDGKGNVTATRLEVKAATYTPGDELEVKGIVQNHNGTDTFEIGLLTVTYSSTTKLDNLPDGIQDGLYVEAKSNEALGANSELIASKIELETKDSSSDDNENEVKDLISEIIPDVSITVGNETFLIDANTEFEPAYDATTYDVGVLVEVEGYYNADGILIAKKIEIEDNYSDMNKVPFMGAVTNVNATGANTGTVTIAGTVIDVNVDTIMIDNSDAKVPTFNLLDVAVDDYLKIKALDNMDGTFTALKLVRENPKTGPVVMQ